VPRLANAAQPPPGASWRIVHSAKSTARPEQRQQAARERVPGLSDCDGWGRKLPLAHTGHGDGMTVRRIIMVSIVARPPGAVL
jgi:hypothetical protein